MTIAIDRPSGPSVFDAGLPEIDYEHCQSPDEAHHIIRAARQQAPIAIGPHGPELLTYDVVRSVLRDPRLRVPQGMFLASQGITERTVMGTGRGESDQSRWGSTSPAAPTGVQAFTPRATARLRTTIVDVITELVDRHTTSGRCEVVTDVARQYPIPIICALLGAPVEDWALFSDWTDDIFKVFSWDVAAHERAILVAWEELDAYIDEMVAHRRHTLTDDLISELIRAEDDGDRLSADELRMLAAGLLIAGTDTTRNQLAASVHVLCDHPEQWALLAQHPEFAMNAVEETMRHSPIAFGTLRTAIEDIEIAGVTIPAGTLVLPNTAAANRDPAVYDDPDRLDITREGAPAMQTFGAGMHYCLGANLARLELAEALTVMAQRMPNARRTGPAPWKPLTALTGPITLPIEFDTGH